MPTLAQKYTVIAPDLRGYGDSDKPQSGYDARTLAEDFHELTEHLGLRQIHLVAHDMGAPPALLYAGTYPDEVVSLTYLEEPVLLTHHLQHIFQFAPDQMRGGGVIVHGRDRDRAEAVAAEIQAEGGKAAVVIGDLSTTDVAQQVAADALQAFGGIDILINNAGLIGHYETWDDVNDQDWAKMYDGVVLVIVRLVNDTVG